MFPNIEDRDLIEDVRLYMHAFGLTKEGAVELRRLLSAPPFHDTPDSAEV